MSRVTTDGVRTPIVSVIVATNVMNKWVDIAVESILEQEGVDFELVVVHDQIEVDRARPWTADDRVRCVATGTSRGLAHALVTGVAVARGAFLARLDGDDVALPGRLKAQVDYLEAHPEVVLVGTRTCLIDEHGESRGRLGVTAPGDVRRLLLTRNVLTHSSVMMRKDAYDASGGYDPSLRQMEDYVLWLHLAGQGEVHVLQQELTSYRVHGQQMSRGAASAGDYIDSVIRGRLALADTLGQPRVVQRLRNVMWRGAQVARHRGWRRLGYERAAVGT